MLKDSDSLRIPITVEYMAGRQARRDGRHWSEGWDGIEDYYRKLDAVIGWHDEHDGVKVEDRAEVVDIAA